MNIRLIPLFSLFLFALSVSPVVSPTIAEVQVLDLASNSTTPGLPGQDAVEKACGEYSLQSVDLESVAGPSESVGQVQILDSNGKPVSVKQLEAGQQVKLSVVVKIDQNQSAEDLQLRLLTSGEPAEVVEKVTTNSDGSVVFSKLVNPGDYKIALACNEGAGIIAGATTAAGGAAAAVLGFASTGGGSGATLFNSDLEGTNPPQADNRPSASDIQ